ncbi:MAG TPA: citrate synthase [Actinomycetota bacterium]|jgi:citrate synthase
MGGSEDSIDRANESNPGAAPPGLRGLAVADTELGQVQGTEGFYHYKQYDAIELAQKRTFEDVWHLFVEGELPSADQRDRFLREVTELRRIPDEVASLLPEMARSPAPAPLSAERIGMSLMAAALALRPALDCTREELRSQCLRLCAVAPSLVAALHRLRRGRAPIDPSSGLGHAANFLFMLSGEEPGADRARALEQYWISTIDHGFNASTFTARIIASTRADVGAAIVGALGALSGPLHGGAPGRVWEMLDEIGSPERAEEWLRAKLERGERIMGFGHAVYRTEDPRSRLLREVAERLGGPRVQLARHVEERSLALLRELRPGHELYTNVEFYASIVLEAVGLPPVLFTSTFALSRIVGWSAHVLEQLADPRIMRPTARYVGPPPAIPVPDLG